MYKVPQFILRQDQQDPRTKQFQIQQEGPDPIGSAAQETGITYIVLTYIYNWFLQAFKVMGDVQWTVYTVQYTVASKKYKFFIMYCIIVLYEGGGFYPIYRTGNKQFTTIPQSTKYEFLTVAIWRQLSRDRYALHTRIRV